MQCDVTFPLDPWLACLDDRRTVHQGLQKQSSVLCLIAVRSPSDGTCMCADIDEVGWCAAQGPLCHVSARGDKCLNENCLIEVGELRRKEDE